LFELAWELVIIKHARDRFTRLLPAIGSGDSGVRNTNMSIRAVLKTLLLSISLVVDARAQGIMPYVYQTENTGAGYPTPVFPSFSDLPSIPALPDPFAWSDGLIETKKMVVTK